MQQNNVCMQLFLQIVRAARGGEASERDQEQTESICKKQIEGQRVPQGKTLYKINSTSF